MKRFVWVTLFLFLASCAETETADHVRPNTNNGEPQSVTQADDPKSPATLDLEVASEVAQGKALVDRLCTQCHLRPDPVDLPKDRWPFVVKWMGHYLGHDRFTGADRSLIMPQFVPDRPKTSLLELQAIETYFVQSSSPEISPESVLPKLETSKWFETRPFFIPVPQNRLVSSICLDETKQRIYLANGSGSNLLEYDFGGRQLAIHRTEKTQAVGIHSDANGFNATLIGDMFALEEAGGVLCATWDNKAMKYRYRFPFKDFFRLAHVEYADINDDDQLDYLASGFGSSGQGSFSLFLSQDNGNHERNDLITHCGSISSRAHDFDHDGDLDILVLTTQGFHDLWLFTNQGDGKFITRRIWKQGPSTGSTSMHLADLNNDATAELIITTGNNFEMKDPPVRPYHGLYIYEDTGNQDFRQVFFQPLPGAVGAKIADFNGDEMLDVILISSLPDWRIGDPESALVLENQGEFRFSVRELPGTRGTQWLSVDSADLDGDGDQDMLLGAMNTTPELSESAESNFLGAMKTQPSVLLLENTTK